jgi:hypothetical protein
MRDKPPQATVPTKLPRNFEFTVIAKFCAILRITLGSSISEALGIFSNEVGKNVVLEQLILVKVRYLQNVKTIVATGAQNIIVASRKFTNKIAFLKNIFLINFVN